MSAIFSKPKIPTPPPVPVPVLPDPVNSPDPAASRSRTQRQQLGRRGRDSTILTSPTGLQPVSNIGQSILGS